MEEFDFNDTAPAPLSEQEFLMENLCVKKGRAPGGYEPPATRSVAKRWKHLNEQNMMSRLNEMHVIKKQNAQMSKEAAREIIRKIPVELLAKEWLSKEDATVDMRAYLVDHILPTLILGVERLLREVDEKGLSAAHRYEPEFNPINFLAQYLMRNNPRFSNFSEASPYVRGLREVSEAIKQELFTFEDNRLARIKAETRRKRADRERLEQEIKAAKDLRQNQITGQFREWTWMTESNKVPLALIQNALRFFTENVDHLPQTVQEAAKFGRPLEPTDETHAMLSEKEFAEYISFFVADFPFEVFHQFMIHMTKCASVQKAAFERENRRHILTNLFLICDYGVLRFMIADRKLGLLDRARIMTLLEEYWDSLMTFGDSMGTLRNPRKWPVVEVQEVDDIMYDAWADEPLGGLLPEETVKQNILLEAISQALDLKIETCAARDKAAKERWKLEQLEQKSAGYRAKLYKYNVTDFMTLLQYPYRDTMEAPVCHFEITEELALKDHDLFRSTATKTHRERHKNLVDDPYDVPHTKSGISLGTATSGKGSLAAKNEGAVEQSDSFSNRKAVEQEADGNRNENSRLGESRPGSSHKVSPFWVVNRNNNTRGEKSSSGTEDEDSVSHSCLSRLPEQRRKVTRGTQVKEHVTDSHQEIDIGARNLTTTRNRPTGKKMPTARNMPSAKIPRFPPSRNYEVISAGKNSLPPKLPMIKAKHGSTPTTLPPVRLHRKTELEQKNVELMKELLESQSMLLALRPASAYRSSVSSLDPEESSPYHQPGEFFWDTNYSNVSENTNTNRCLRTRIIKNVSASVQAPKLSAFNEAFLDLPQFVQLMETFIGPVIAVKEFSTIVHFLTDRYIDTEQEKTDKLLQSRQTANLAKKKQTLDLLFEKWDNDASGFLEVEEVLDIMFKFKDGQEAEAIKTAQLELKKQSEYYDGRLSKKEFRQFITLVLLEIPGKETFDLLVEFLMNSVERSYSERIRGEARKKWLQQINLAAQTSGTSMEPVYKSVFQALYKDAETHGSEKRISASISLLETNRLEPNRGQHLLRYSACTPEDCQYMLGKPLYRNQKGVSFQAVETGRPVHVPRVAQHGSVYFWNYDRPASEREGSFVAVPLKDGKKRVFGVLGVDTMIDPKTETIFITHEIQFFQGVAKAFSIAYHTVEKRRKFLRVLESATAWFKRHCPNIREIDVYLREPSTRVTGDFVLHKMMTTDKNGTVVHIAEVTRLERKDNYFRKYLFESIETSETVVADIHLERHAACPVRGNTGLAIGIIDFNTGVIKNLPLYESKEAQRMLRLVQKAYDELEDVSVGGQPQCVLGVEANPLIRTDIMFERIMLQELRDNIARLDPQSFAEIKGYFEPPRIIAEILRVTLAIFKVDQVGEGEYDTWEELRNALTGELIQQIKTHDPIALAHLNNVEKVYRYLKATFSAPFVEIARQNSISAQQLYNWVLTCLSLMEYILHLKESAEGSALLAVVLEGY